MLISATDAGGIILSDAPPPVWNRDSLDVAGEHIIPTKRRREPEFDPGMECPLSEMYAVGIHTMRGGLIRFGRRLSMTASSSSLEIPNFGQLLAQYIVSVPEASRPRFLARLERGAADRYRSWAAALPDHADELLECAASEDEIAIRVESLYAAIPEDLAKIEAALPLAKERYFAVFEGLSIAEQLAVQAQAERQGSQAWQGLKHADLSPAHAKELDELTALELTSAERVEALLEKLGAE